MANFYELNEEQQKFLTRRFWNFKKNAPFVPTHMMFLEDTEQGWYVVSFLARNQKGLQYFFSRKKLEANFLSEDRTNEWIDILEMMEYTNKHFPLLPERIYIDLQHILR